MDHTPFLAKPGEHFSLKNYDCAFTGQFKEKEDAEDKLNKDIRMLEQLQAVLYAQNTYGVLIIIQAMDAAGKDSVIKHVMSGVNPQGVQVTSFKSPSESELDHDYLWRHTSALPRRGEIGIFNRSYYEEVLVVRVHPEFLQAQRIPKESIGDERWKERFRDINNYEGYLSRNGFMVLKFFLHVSRREQKKRFLERIDQDDKNWKFSSADLKERAHWNAYMKAYEEMIRETSTDWAPWYVVPADHKWFTRAVVADLIVSRMKGLHLAYPVTSKNHRADLSKAKKSLEKE